MEQLNQVFHEITGRHAFIQAHLDDLAFSASYSTSLARQNFKNIAVFTIFGRETFNVRGLPLDSSTEAVLHREEQAWVDSNQFQFKRYTVEEAGFRGVHGVRNLFHSKDQHRLGEISMSMEERVFQQVKSSMQEILKGEYESIWIPAGVGGHCDHVMVRECAIYLARKLECVKYIMFYEEMPYRLYSKKMDWETINLPGFEMVNLIETMGSEDVRKEKESNLRFFWSQITEQEIRPILSHAEVVAVWKQVQERSSYARA